MATMNRNLHMSMGLAMGTLNTCLVMLTLVLALHLSDELSGFLGSLSTAVGLAVFALLWSTVTYCTYRGWAEIAPEGLSHTRDSHFFTASAHWGAVNGMMVFFAGLTVFLLASSFVVATGMERGSLLAIWIFGIVAAAFGLVLSATVGFVLGVAVATVDFLLAKLVAAFLRPPLAP